MTDKTFCVSFTLPTATKLFCNCSEAPFKPNTRCCPTCLGLPGAMPSLNGEAVRLAVDIVKRLDCALVNLCVFHKQSFPAAPSAQRCGALRMAEMGHGKYDVSLTEHPGTLDYNGMINYNRRGAPVIEIYFDPEGVSPEAEAERIKDLLEGLVCQETMQLRPVLLDAFTADFTDCDIRPVILE